MRRHICRLILIAATISGAAACDERLSDVAGPTPNLEPTFASIQRDIFEAPDSSGRPNCNRCHTTIGRTPPRGLSLEHDVAYDLLVRVASTGKPGAVRVVPGDPENSYIVQNVEGRAGIVGARMPTNGPFLTDGQIRILKRWIESGAQRN